MMQETILITGCSSGIGLAAADRMKRRGWRVFATARRGEDLQMLRDDIGVEALHLELADGASILRCADDVLEACEGRLTALFNNAAYGQPGAVEDLSAEVLRQQMEVNFIGTHDLTRRIIPAMRAAGRGRIVQCSSVLGFVTGPYRGAYSASKFALEGLTDAMRLELRGTGIKVSLIEPGPIRTKFVERSLDMAERNVPIDESVHREKYESLLQSMRAGGKQTFKLEPDVVVDKLIHAVESANPKVRYFVTKPTYAAALMKRVLPDKAMDWITARR